VRESCGRSRWLRFSLCTLVIAVLLLGGVASLVEGWPPWQLRFRLGGCACGNPAGTVFSPNGDLLASTDGKLIHVWNTKSGVRLLTLECPESVRFCVFSPDGESLLSLSLSSMAVWSARSGALRFSVNGRFYHASYSPNGDRVVATNGDSVAIDSAGFWRGQPADGTSCIWDAGTGTEICVLRGHSGYVLSAGFTRDGKRIATGGEDGKVRIWDSTTGKELLMVRGHAGAVRSVCFSPDDRRLATGGTDGHVRLWDAETGAVAWESHIAVQVWSVCFSSDGRHLAVCADYTCPQLLVSATGQKSVELEGSETGQVILVSDAEYPWAAQFSQDGRALLGRCNTGFSIWDVTNGKRLANLEDPKGQEDCFLTAFYSPTGQEVADSQFRVWHCRRPESWWGVAWLPEFWLVILLGCAFAWSVWRDRCVLSGPRPGGPPKDE
jgi:WD40 repeat protein